MTANRWLMGLLLLGACAHGDDVSLRPFKPRHVRLVADGFTYLDGMIMIPPDFDGPFKLGALDYSFERELLHPPGIELVTNLAAPLVFKVPPEELIRPCHPPNSGGRVGDIVRRQESPDGVQVVCRYRDPADQLRVWYEVVRLQHWGVSPHDPLEQDLWLSCSVYGMTSEAVLQGAWDICATLHLARVTRNVGIKCREHLDINMSRNYMPECDEYEATPLE